MVASRLFLGLNILNIVSVQGAVSEGDKPVLVSAMDARELLSFRLGLGLLKRLTGKHRKKEYA